MNSSKVAKFYRLHLAKTLMPQKFSGKQAMIYSTLHQTRYSIKDQMVPFISHIDVLTLPNPVFRTTVCRHGIESHLIFDHLRLLMFSKISTNNSCQIVFKSAIPPSLTPSSNPNPIFLMLTLTTHSFANLSMFFGIPYQVSHTNPLKSPHLGYQVAKHYSLGSLSDLQHQFFI